MPQLCATMNLFVRASFATWSACCCAILSIISTSENSFFSSFMSFMTFDRSRPISVSRFMLNVSAHEPMSSSAGLKLYVPSKGILFSLKRGTRPSG